MVEAQQQPREERKPIRIRIKLKSYDHTLLDRTVERIVKTARQTDAIVRGPIPLPTRRKIFTVLRSPHVNKDSREQFMLRIHTRLIDIYPRSVMRTVEALRKLTLPSGVDIELKSD